MPRPKQQEKISFELIVHSSRRGKLFSILFRASMRWQYVEYFPDGSVGERVDIEADEFIRVLDKIKQEREALITPGNLTKEKTE